MSSQRLTSVPEAIVEALESEGVRFVFGLAGSHILPILDRLASTSEIRHVVVKHENSAAVMAGMYGYLTGRPGIALVTAGPGAAHCVSGVALAYTSSHPMVLISGGVPVRAANEAYHGVDREGFLQEMFLPITKHAVRVLRPERVSETLAHAFALASSDRPGPVFVEIPVNILRGNPIISRPYTASPVRRRTSATSLLDAALRGLTRSQRPIICAGRGVLVQQAEMELLTLVERLCAPVFWTTYADGVMPEEHPLAVGPFDQWTENPLAWELMKESDFLLVVGMRSGSLLSEILSEHSPSTAVFASLDEPETFRPVEFASTSGVADARTFLSLIFDQLAGQQRQTDPSVLSRIGKRKRALGIGRDALLARHYKAHPMHFGCVLHEIASQVPHETVVVAGVGNHSVWARTIFSLRGRDSFIATGPWGTMGAELAGGICAKLVYPDRQVVVVTGDGSLLMTLPDLLTAVEVKANVLIVVLNDSRYGMITAMQTKEFGRPFGDQIASADFARLAESLGMAAVRVERVEGLKEAVGRSVELSIESPVVLDVVCDHAFGWPEWEALVEGGLKQLDSVG